MAKKLWGLAGEQHKKRPRFSEAALNVKCRNLFRFGSNAGFDHLAVFDAFGADPNSFNRAAFFMTHGLQIGLPEFFGLIVGVRNVIAVLGVFTANITYAGHGDLPLSGIRFGHNAVSCICLFRLNT